MENYQMENDSNESMNMDNNDNIQFLNLDGNLQEEEITPLYPSVDIPSGIIEIPNKSTQRTTRERKVTRTGNLKVNVDNLLKIPKGNITNKKTSHIANKKIKQKKRQKTNLLKKTEAQSIIHKPIFKFIRIEWDRDDSKI